MRLHDNKYTYVNRLFLEGCKPPLESQLEIQVFGPLVEVMV